MAYRLKLVPEHTNIDFFRWQRITFGGSVALVIVAIIATCLSGPKVGSKTSVIETSPRPSGCIAWR